MSLCDDKISLFVDDYENVHQQFEHLALYTKQDCDQILESIGIKGVVTCRTKKPASLERKLGEMAEDPKFRAWLDEEENEILDHEDMGDLAGVRIGLYFPEDVIPVAKALQERFEVIHLFGTVAGGRDTSQERNLDVGHHLNGPWRTQDADGNDEFWEHSGYKSWQMVAKWTESLPDGLDDRRFEIQVGTIVTQAWAEVQHNIIYKRSADVLATPTMKRMIDAINGLAITTEIMLNELSRSLEAAAMEAERRTRRSFMRGEDFWRWFTETYVDKMDEDEQERYAYDDRTVMSTNFLIELCIGGYEWVVGEDPDLPSPCPAVFKPIIEERILPAVAGGNGLVDLGRAILYELGYDEVELGHNPDMDMSPELLSYRKI